MNVAFIPVRGGSKSIPLKNIREINGKPLVYWTIQAACGCNYIDKVYIATDSVVIKQAIEGFKNEMDLFLYEKVEIIGRSEASASDTASTELAMLEFAANYEFDNIVLIQATSPLLTYSNLNEGFEVFLQEDTDSVLSVVKQKRFYWKNDQEGYTHPVNYDVYHRPRRQEFDGCLVENGAFYISSKKALVKSQNRISGNIKAVEMDEDTFLEIDELSDWLIVEALMRKKALKGLENPIPNIKMFLTDCDGCLTDCGMYYSEYGDEIKKFNTRDGMGFALLREQGILTGIVTSESVDLNRRRAQKMGIDVLIDGCKNKMEAINNLCTKYQIPLKNVAYIGDDINDLEVIQKVGYGCSPADGMQEVKDCAKYISKTKGGEGVIREVVEKILYR